MPDSVPTISLKLEDTALSQALGDSFAQTGFAIVRDHGISPDLINRAEAAMRAFFALPVEVKQGYLISGSGGARGYTAFGVEKAKDATRHDLKEFWHVGRDLPEDHPFARDMPPNVWPSEVAGFEETFTQLFAALDHTGGRLLSAIARWLGLASDFFDDTVRDGNSVLRLIHYPPVEAGEQAVRAAAHEDINTITLLLGAEEAGLELLTRDGKWLPVQPKAGELAVNIGDMLQRLTNHRLPSTSHRVVNPAPDRQGVARYSMSFFLHFRPDYLIRTMPDCVDANHPDRYPYPITAQDFLLERLREINLV